MTYFDEKLKDLHRQRAQKKRLEAQLQELAQQENEVAKKVAELAEVKKKEQMDVDKLEGKNIKVLFFTLAGSIDEKLSKERQEAYTATMKYDAAFNDLRGIQADISYCKDELAKLTDCEAEYQHLYEQKKNSLKMEASRKANDIMLMEKDISSLGNEIVELEEALDAGYRAFDLADNIVTELEEADKLAEWDTFMDSMLIDMQKHEHLNSAQDMIADLRNELRRFKTELADVQIDSDIQIEMDDFSKFADWFFDNIFTDWDIKEKIENSLAQAQNTREQITSTIHVLKDMRDERMRKRAQIQEQLEEAVVEG
ncbi:MAG: hypothetical protein IJA07_01520 [Agathobacter sp.]|nr:hypothetical protein [Agathobacter sp.]